MLAVIETLLVLALKIIGVWLIGVTLLFGWMWVDDKRLNRKEAAERAQRVRGQMYAKAQAKALLARGGPQTLEECLFLFPDACHRCGCRDFKSYSGVWYAVDETGHWDGYNNTAYWRRCDGCGYSPDEPTWASVTDISSSSRRAESSLLTLEEQDFVGHFHALQAEV